MIPIEIVVIFSLIGLSLYGFGSRLVDKKDFQLQNGKDL
tara:strand:- start:309 stop:425 length:117 start_codon:yes stop_codon:yes gene_type:complete